MLHEVISLACFTKTKIEKKNFAEKYHNDFVVFGESQLGITCRFCIGVSGTFTEWF